MWFHFGWFTFENNLVGTTRAAGAGGCNQGDLPIPLSVQLRLEGFGKKEICNTYYVWWSVDPKDDIVLYGIVCYWKWYDMMALH